MTDKKKTVLDIFEMLQTGQKITMLTAYDFVLSSILDEVGTDILLVGDTMGMVVYGDPTTLTVTLEDTIRHTRAVSRGAKRAMVVGDLPFGTFQITPEETVRNAIKVVQLGNAEAIKLEGGSERVAAIQKILEAGIPVMGHLGLTPQSFHKMGGFKVQGRSEEAGEFLIEEAKALEETGIFSLVLEAIPWKVAKKITETLTRCATIGIGAGPYCDGQVLVSYDMLGYFDFKAKFVKRFANLKSHILEAGQKYNQEVRNGTFPDLSYSYE